MEGGSKISVNLEAPLDVSSSDMLTPVSQQTLQHNWQKYQGKFLPNSLRFEKNGWAAGWNVYNFSYNSFRKKLDDIWLGATTYNSDGTKLLSVYDSEDSAASKKDTIVNPKTIIKSVDGYEAEVSGDDIKGIVNEKAYNIAWDANAHVAAIDNIDLSLDQELLSDYSTKFTITDLTSSYDLQFECYLPSSLTGDAYSNVFQYTGYDGSIYSWEDYTFDGINVTTPDNKVIVPTIVGNTISFDYEVDVNDETGVIQFTLEDYYVEFDVTKMQQLAGEDYVITSSATKKNIVNRYQNVSVPDLISSLDTDSKVYIAAMPVWFTVNIRSLRASQDAQKCDNVKGGCVQIFTDGHFSYVEYDATNIYGSNMSGTLVFNDSVTAAVGLIYRFNKIQLHDAIGPGEGWSPNEYKIRTSAYVYSAGNFSGYITEDYLDAFGLTDSNILKYDPRLYLKNNVWWNFSDPSNHVYNSDISVNIPVSVVGISDSYTMDTTHSGLDDPTFAYNVCDNAHPAGINFSYPSSATAYAVTQAAKNYGQLYVNGKYIGNTYEDTTQVLTNDENFWPFTKVPKFNLLLSDGTEVSGVYWTDGTNYITDLETLKRRLGIGSADYDTNASAAGPLEANDVLVRTRIVTHFNSAFDFTKYTETTVASKAFDETWEKYYPSYDNPQNYSVDTSSDIDPNSFTDIQEHTITPIIWYMTPGQEVRPDPTGNRSEALAFGNSEGVILYDTDTDNYVANLYHQHIHAESVYNRFEPYHFPGYLHSWFGSSREIYDYYGTATSIRLVRHYEGELGERSWVAGLRHAAAGVHVNYTYKPEEHHAEHGTYYTYEHVPMETVNAGCWIKNGYFGTDGCVLESNGPSIVAGVYMYGSLTGGYHFAIALQGYLGFKVRFPQIRTAFEINDKAAACFIVEQITAADITDNDNIWLCDGNIGAKSHSWLRLEFANVVADNGEGKGHLDMTVDTLNGFQVYYANRVTNTKGTEILADYYIPPVSMAAGSEEEGNMSSSDEPMDLQLIWKPDVYTMPSSAVINYTPVNSLKLNHMYFVDEYKNMQFDVSIGDLIYNGRGKVFRELIFSSEGVERFRFNYNCQTQSVVWTGPVQVYLSDYADVSVSSITCVGADGSFNLAVKLDFPNNRALFTKITKYDLLADTDNIIRISDGTHVIDYNYVSQAPVTKVNEYTVQVIDGHQLVTVSDHVSQEIVAYMKAAYNGLFDGTKVTFSYQGKDYIFDMSELEKDSDNIVEVLSTDIRRPTKTKTIGKIIASSDSAHEYQLVRQQWNTTVETENFWWINETHVLELTQEYFILKRKISELDDWNGDRFEDIYHLPRINFVDSSSLYYTCTNVYGTADALFYKLYVYNTGTIACTIYNPLKDMLLVDTVYFTVNRHNIGDVLNDKSVTGKTAYLNTYNALTAGQILSKAVFSNTLVDGSIIFGIHQSNNYDQWAIVYNLNTKVFTKCIQGYGYVGLHGDLTGGMLPKDYFDVSKGFNSKVEDISVLTAGFDANDADNKFIIGNINNLNNITARVVGTSERQWYISNQLYGIVSHLSWNGTGFSINVIPLTNKYASVYKSPSFGASRIGDLMVEVFPMANLLKLPSAANSVWQVFMTCIGQPSLYMFNPRFAYLNYMQQTLGQYAYVHYNSSESMPEKEKGDFDNKAVDAIKGTDLSGSPEQKALLPLLNEAHTFDKQIIEQSADVGLTFNDFGSILFAAFAGALQMFDAKQSVNEEQKQTATSDTGRKYLSNVMANADALLASSIMTQSAVDSGVVSKVAGIKSLDMFYSTSDQQRVYAGPGFVEQQFVAQCVSQSSTDTQVEGKVMQLSFTIRALTELQQRLTTAAMEASIKALEEMANAMKEGSVCGSNYGAAVAAGLLATAAALRASLVAKAVGDEQISKLLDVICASGITVSCTGGVTRHAMNPEGKHKYGEKHESFIWPCWDADNLKYTDETVNTAIKTSYWQCTLKPQKYWSSSAWDSLMVNIDTEIPSSSSAKSSSTYIKKLRGNVPFYQAACYGTSTKRKLPAKMAKVEGVESFLPKEPFKNENIAASDPMFTSSFIHDYIIDESWELGQCATYGLQQWVTVKDTKITNCPPSNMIVSNSFCGVAAPYEAVEVKRGLTKNYMRPWAITPNTLAFNCTGYNTILDNKLYHAFDGISYRIVDLVGSAGMNKEFAAYIYAFQVNDRFKRSNICPPNEMLGNFNSEPVQSLQTIDRIWTTVTQASRMKGLEIGTVGEDKDAVRWAIPIFTEQVSLLPSAVKTMAACTLAVVEGITSLVTQQVTDTNAAYKAPLSVDFTIGKNVYRATEEYICSVTPAEAGNVVTDLIPSLGLMYIGATPSEAYFYSRATRCYYLFTGSSLTKVAMMERFRNIQSGHWDFVNQEVVMPCLMTFKRLNEEVIDKDTETDNIIVPVLSKGQVSGELPPPLTTIFNDRSWYKVVSLPSGLAYQGPNRVIINRSVFVEYMLDTLKQNIGKWSRMDREKYVTKREYQEKYTDVITDVKGVEGWTYNPFVFVTSAFGQSEDSDSMFEWLITFCWPIEMDLIYGQDNFACVNILAETMTPGGKMKSRPTHVFLTKELFTRNGSYGYYSFRFQSKNGAGNRERLHIWSDQYIAVSSIFCEVKVITSRRTEQLTQQLDVQKLKEL